MRDETQCCTSKLISDTPRRESPFDSIVKIETELLGVSVQPRVGKHGLLPPIARGLQYRTSRGAPAPTLDEDLRIGPFWMLQKLVSYVPHTLAFKAFQPRHRSGLV